MLIKNVVIRFVIGIISLILAFGLLRSIVGHFTRGDSIEARRQRLIKEQARNEQLKMELKTATSASFVEKQAREKLGFAKESDTIILLDTSHVERSGGSTPQRKYTSYWEKWLSLFF